MGITSKAIAARGQAQAKKMGVDPGRIPPGQYLTERFPVLTYGSNPSFDLKSWSLSIDGEVDAPYALGWDELMALEQVELTTDIHCVTRWSKLDTTWRGVRVRDLLDRAQVRPSGTHVMAHSDGGYTTNIPLAALYDDDVLVAHTYDGKPLEHDHWRAAAPARPQAVLLEVGEVPAPPGGHAADRRGSGSSTATTTTPTPGRTAPLVLEPCCS
jgi:DMSO/TMAO reductase YedYZ molybdopterin-dependent catalytic subunit